MSDRLDISRLFTLDGKVDEDVLKDIFNSINDILFESSNPFLFFTGTKKEVSLTAGMNNIPHILGYKPTDAFILNKKPFNARIDIDLENSTPDNIFINSDMPAEAKIVFGTMGD